MDDKLVRTFLALAGQQIPEKRDLANVPEKLKTLGAQLLLSEVLEYVIKGLGVTPTVNGVAITAPDALSYKVTKAADEIEMLDGLADVAYTMYWNALAFNLPLEKGFELVSQNNLEKFIRLTDPVSFTAKDGRKIVEQGDWHLGLNVSWPADVQSVELIDVEKVTYAVGKDSTGKVRKPSTYRPVDLSSALS